MALQKYLDGGGVQYLWSKLLEKLKTETITEEDIADYYHVVDESYPEQTIDFGTQSWNAQVTKTLSSSLFTISNELKLLKITVTGKVEGKFIGVGEFNYAAKFSVNLPSGGRYFLWNVNGNLGFINGGTSVFSRSITSGALNSQNVNASTSFYITRIS